ncbi:protein FAR-RED IMPAIRED RESPONSE 1 isoform X3 [Telopea speciosissima]|uniref:protein FAR-RED IMPAIRED RESPONSE 1 isoform X3 n=1 Tax=Telopea speciosissima TaxID=54955 RepID=UPI001CC47B8B|nr:protein FAR-RED IMPAIRED RESPONSE 1 isoform X3 [Telopea speciosissima]
MEFYLSCNLITKTTNLVGFIDLYFECYSSIKKLGILVKVIEKNFNPLMAIDLEQPSAERDTEDVKPNMDEHVMDGGDEVDMNSPEMDSAVIKGDTMLEPRMGMEFESNGEAYSFYREYARVIGFGTSIKNSRRSKISGEFIDAKFACSRYGTKHESSKVINPRPCLKTDCKASMHVKRKQDGKWVVHDFIKEHNHDLLPAQAHFFRSHRSINIDALYAIKRRRKMYSEISKQSGGLQNVGYLNNDFINQFHDGLHLDLEVGDVQAMLEHFMDMQDENSNFFYAMDLNEEHRLRTVFWVDAKGRHDYINFGDVVSFDTTYVTNKYKMPLAPFVGVNHHFQCVLLGCALIADDTVSTYVWLMRTWLRAMGGRAPSMIITDQDKALKAAIAEVFPSTRHCLGLWHIIRKIPEKLGNVAKRHENFVKKFNKCIYKSWTDEQFEKRWWKMVDRFELKEDEWIQSLYEDRIQWVPTYVGTAFLAGMSTAQRSESVNSYFDKYIHRKTTLKEFVEQYISILEDRYEEEAKADLDTWQKLPVLKSPSPFEKQMSTVYTQAIFKKFQVEVLGAIACHPKKEKEDESTITFRVQDFEDNQDFIVEWNEPKLEISCLCRSFEYKGFICRHAMIVLQISGISSIPSHYILKRWTKDAKSRYTMRQGLEGEQSRVQRYNDLCQRAIKLGEEGSLSQESYNIAFRALDEALKQCVSVNSSIHNGSDSSLPATYGLQDIEENDGDNRASILRMLEPQGARSTKKKNTNKKRKVQPEPKVMSVGNVGTQNNLQQMGNLNSRAPALGGSFVPQQSIQGMEQLNSRAPTFNGYGTQRSVQRMGQLNSIAPTGDSYYGTQQSMQGMGQLDFRSPTIDSCYCIQESLQDMGESNVGPSQLHGMTSRHLHDKHLSN